MILFHQLVQILHVLDLPVIYLFYHVTYYSHVKTMVFAAIRIRRPMDINVNVQMISVVPIVKSIIAFVIQIHVGIMVYIFTITSFLLTLFPLGNCSVSNTTFDCTCVSGWEGSHCETQINYCGNVTCLNDGVCRPLLRDYKCECLNGSFYGVHCEITTTRVIIFRIVSKSFAFIAILAMTTVVTFVVVMDVLKYYFDIDPVKENRMLLRQMQQEKQDRSDRIRLIVNVI